MRKKFTTTLTEEHKRRLAILSASEGIDKNKWIEQKVDEEWGKYVNEVANGADRGK